MPQMIPASASPRPQIALAVPARPSSSKPSLPSPRRALRAGSVKDVSGHFVKDVMRLNKTAKRGAPGFNSQNPVNVPSVPALSLVFRGIRPEPLPDSSFGAATFGGLRIPEAKGILNLGGLRLEDVASGYWTLLAKSSSGL